MRTSPLRLFATASIILTACSGSTAPSPSPVTYEGVFAAGAASGRVTLVTGSPASGSLNATGASAVALSGTFTPATSTFALTGGGYTVNASVNAAAALTGTVTTAGAPAGGALAALASSTSAPVKNYCGGFSQDNNAPGVPKETGTLNVTINESLAYVTGVAVQLTGEGSPSPGIVVTGSIIGTALELGFAGGYATGTRAANGNLSGLFSNQYNVTGVWYANVC